MDNFGHVWNSPAKLFLHALDLSSIPSWFACFVGKADIVVAGLHNSSGSHNRSLFHWSAPLLCSYLQLFSSLFCCLCPESLVVYFFLFASPVCIAWKATILKSDGYIAETYKDRSLSHSPYNPLFVFASMVRHTFVVAVLQLRAAAPRWACSMDKFLLLSRGKMQDADERENWNHFFFHVGAGSSWNTQQKRANALASAFGWAEVFDFKPWKFQSPYVVNCPVVNMLQI